MQFKTSLLLFFINTLGFAQNTITGEVYENNKPSSYIEVVLYDAASKPLTSTFTDEKGKFTLPTQKGNYKVEGRLLGKILFTKEVMVEKNVDLGKLEIQTTQELTEVVVESRKKLIERKVDRLVFNVENSIAASGGDALDALKVTPGLRVQNDQVSIIGKGSMMVMVDGRMMQLSGESLMSYLKTINSDNIKSIEVITTPPAKYDAEGNSGIINIKLKKTKPNTWNSTFRSTYSQSYYATGTISNGFNYKKNKTTLSTNFNFTNGAKNSIETQNVEYSNQNLYSDDKIKNFTNILSGKVFYSYKLSEKFTIGTQLFISNNKPDINHKNYTNVYDLNNNISQNINTELTNKRKNNNYSVNIHSNYKIDTLGREIFVDFDYFKFERDNNQFFITKENLIMNNSTLNTSVNNIGDQKIRNFSAKIDVEHPFKKISLSYGVKITNTISNNNLFFYDIINNNPILNINKSNNFSFTENNQAIYISGTKKILNDKIEMQLGFRYENTMTIGRSETLNKENEFNYSKLFPTFYLSYNPSENNTFSLNYSKRINRPRFTMLNPFRDYNSPYSYVEGNPNLQPSFIDNYNFSHTFKSNLNTSIYYSNEQNGFSTITLINNNGIDRETTILNYFNTHDFGIDISYTFKKIKNWESYNSGSFYHKTILTNNTALDRKTSGYGAYISSNNSIIFNKKRTFSSNLNLYYAFPNTNLNSVYKSEFDTSIGLKYLLLNKSLIINLNFFDIFKTSKQRWREKTNNIYANYTNYSDVQSINLSVSYSFGNNKLKTKNIKEGNIEEKNRANN